MATEKITTRHISPYHAVQGTEAEIMPYTSAQTGLGAERKTWNKIETAPIGAALLVAYDSGYIRAIAADDNDHAWARYDAAIPGVDLPTHWMLQADLLALIKERPEVSP